MLKGCNVANCSRLEGCGCFEGLTSWAAARRRMWCLHSGAGGSVVQCSGWRWRWRHPAHLPQHLADARRLLGVDE